MSLSREQHLRFWRTFATDLGGRRTLVESLEHLKAELAGTDFVPVVEELVRCADRGEVLSHAMKQLAAAFSGCACSMMEAAKSGGGLEVAANRIAEGIEDGSFPLPGAGPVAADDPVAYWRAFARLLSSGVPILQALGLLSAEVAGPKLRGATASVRKTIDDGSSMAHAMRTCGNVFPLEVCAAVEVGEREGTLDGQALRIAAALETGDLASLVDQPSAAADEEPHLDDLTELSQASPVVKLVSLVLLQAIKDRASDIHFDPEKEGGRIRYRVDGVLYEMVPPPKHLFRNIISRLKVMAGLNTAERRLPQDGRIELVISGNEVDLRISTLPTHHGERVVLRVFDREIMAAALALTEMGLTDEDLEKVRRLCHLPDGVVVVNGPTGSGKTTLLYSMLQEINRPDRAIITIEDPIEYELAGIAQTAVNPGLGRTFANLMRSSLRQAPNVIMVGEMRDPEVVNICVQMAMTGHLVFTTVHARTSPGAIRRLLDIGLPPFMINASLSAVISVRLVRRLCPACRQPAEPPAHLTAHEALDVLSTMQGAQFFAPKGCSECATTGFHGRTALHEILVMDDRIRQLVSDGADMAAVREAACAAGMKTLLQNGIAKAAQGITSIEEVMRVVPYADLVTSFARQVTERGIDETLSDMDEADVVEGRADTLARLFVIMIAQAKHDHASRLTLGVSEDKGIASYVVEGKEHTMLPPPADVVRAMIKEIVRSADMSEGDTSGELSIELPEETWKLAIHRGDPGSNSLAITGF